MEKWSTVATLSPRQLIRLVASGIAPLGGSIDVNAFDASVSPGYYLLRHDWAHAQDLDGHLLTFIPDQATRFVDQYFKWVDPSTDENDYKSKFKVPPTEAQIKKSFEDVLGFAKP